MIRLYVPEGHKITIEQDHYLRRVMRKDIDSKIYCFNETGEWLCKIDGTRIQKIREPAHIIEKTIGIGCIKKTRIEWVVEKLTEVGVTTLQLLETDHSQPYSYDLARLKKISIESAEQSNHLAPMKIERPVPLRSFIQDKQVTFCQSGTKNFNTCSNILLIGPEGGWSPNEIGLIRDSISFGSMTLRSETAAIIGGFLLVSY